jgi:hypothetical protein
MIDTPTATEKLADLKDRAADLKERRAVARTATRSGQYAAAKEVTAPLQKFRDDIQLQRPGAVPPENRATAEKGLTDQFLHEVSRRGIVLRVFGSGNAVELVDPAVLRDLDEAEAAYTAIGNEIREFETLAADELEAERKAADAARIKDALAGDDGDAIREALTPTVERSDVLTTAELPGVNRRHSIIREV